MCAVWLLFSPFEPQKCVRTGGLGSTGSRPQKSVFLGCRPGGPHFFLVLRRRRYGERGRRHLPLGSVLLGSWLGSWTLLAPVASQG